MSKKVLILSGSPRKSGNSDILCDEFAKGATEAGHNVGKIRVSEKNIHPCIAFYHCSKNSGACVFKDRTVARWLEVKNKEFYYITTMADNEKSSADTTLACFRGFADCIEGAVEKGTVVAGGVYEKGEIKNHPAMKLAYQMGKNV